MKFYNNTNGVFVSNTTLFNVGEDAYGLAVTDLDNDDDFDLITGNKVGHIDFYINKDLNSMIFEFNLTISTRDQPYGITTGDSDLDGHVDVFIGDRGYCKYSNYM